MMEYDGGRGRSRGADGFRPSSFLPDYPMGGDQRGQVTGEYHEPSRALALLEELGMRVTKESVVLMPVLVSLLKHEAAVVIRQSIVSGTGFFCAVLEEIALQLHSSGKVERWLEEIWSWMLKFKDAVCGILSEPGSFGTKAVAVKFLEVYVLAFTVEGNNGEGPFTEGNSRNVNISRLVGSHPILDPAVLAFEVKQCLDLLLDLMKSAGTVRGSFRIVIINCLAAIARKRPAHYNGILSALLSFDPEFENLKGAHAASIRYSLRSAFLGFLRCMHHPSFVESREKLLWALRTMNPGESTEQIIRQVEKMSKNMERVSRDARFIKEDSSANQISVSGDLVMKKVVQASDGLTITDEMPAKRMRFNTHLNSVHSQEANDPSQDNDEDDNDAENGYSSKSSVLDSNLAAVEQMIAMIGAMLAEGERGVESLEILISQIQPELLADIVIVNMKHLPKSPLPGNLQNASQTTSSGSTTVTGSMGADIPTFHSSGLSPLYVSPSLSSACAPAPTTDVAPLPNLMDSKRDPRRDPRRLDPRRVMAPGGAEAMPSNAENFDLHSGLDASLSRAMPDTTEMKTEISSASLILKPDSELPESSTAPSLGQLAFHENSVVPDEVAEVVPSLDNQTSSSLPLSPVHTDPDLGESTPSEVMANEAFDSDMLESDQYSSVVSSSSISEQASQELPSVPLYVELTDDQLMLFSKSAILRITEDYKPIQATTGCVHTCLSLLARLVAQTNDDGETIAMLQNHIVSDYQHQKGHELAMHVLYHLHSMMVSESNEYDSSFASSIYEKFLLALAKSLRDSLPASDKSFSRLLGEVPFLPDSCLKLLEDLCHSSSGDQNGKDSCDGDRVTQGLGTVWSLILSRPVVRQACLDIALQCTIHPQDEVRAKAIRLVANKLYLLSHVSENIEQFAKAKLLSLVDQRVQDVELGPVGSNEQRIEVGSQDTSVSGSQNSELGVSESDSAKGVQPIFRTTSNVSLSQAQRFTSLFFALCTKRTSLLQVVFDIYWRAPKAVRQSIHRHVPILIRNLGSSYSNLLQIISDPPEGSENLLMLVLQILTEEMTPSADLIATVKHLYEAKLKDAAILIPMLSSLSKEEVLPIFPRLVDLPLDKFQTALARILEGSAHTGPALTPAEVLVAIHDIDPEKDGVPLKKIMDACTACFEQRTVFTQQVLSKSLGHLVDRTPLPLLFMRTVIQAIDAFPTLVDFVMEILSKLVAKQIWKMPKLWVGFLKCASQTQPHSFRVLLQLPPQQLETVLHRHANLRAPLSAHASQTSIRNSLPRPTLAVLGLS